MTMIKYRRLKSNMVRNAARIFLKKNVKLTIFSILIIGSSVLLLLQIFDNRVYVNIDQKQHKYNMNDFKNYSTQIIIITPTYKRYTRIADMTRMSNTLRLIPNVYWLLIEDGLEKSKLLENLLKRSEIPYTYLVHKTEAGYPKRGWYQRDMALTFLRNNHKQVTHGFNHSVVYFGDDDNSYDTRLFTNYIANVKKVGIWAVGHVGGAVFESPKVEKDNPKALFGKSCKRGGGAPEPCLLESLGFTKDDLEPFGFDKPPGESREILVYHTKTTKPKSFPQQDLYGYDVELIFFFIKLIWNLEEMLYENNETEFNSFYKPKGLMKTLNRINAQNLESGGLNNFSEAFQSFMTRVKFFSVGRLRRTYSSSALEFMKYRTLLPMIVGNECDNGSSFDNFDSDIYSKKCDDLDNGYEKVIVSNIPLKVSTTQCKAFFSKYGKIISCDLSFDDRSNTTGTSSKSGFKVTSTAVITFASKEDVEKLLIAEPEDLKLYGHIMKVDKADLSLKKSVSIIKSPNTNHGILSFDNSFTNIDNGIINRFSRTPSSNSLSTSNSLNEKIVSWNGLPNKAIQKILSYLTHIECLKLERVNKKWLEAGIKVWTQTTTISFKDHKKIGRIFTKEKPLTLEILKQFLQRGGINLKKLDLSSVPNTLDESAFIVIGKYCKLLETLDISGIHSTIKNIIFLGEYLNIKYLSYRNMTNIDEKCFWYLIKGFFDTLVSVDFRGCKMLRGQCFISLTNSLEKLYLDGCYALEARAIEDVCMQAQGLKVLKLNGCFNITDEYISLIGRTLLDLEVFSLHGDGYKYLSPSSLTCLTLLKNLVELSFDYNSLVNDDFIIALCKSNRNIKKLSFAYSGDENSITSDGLSTIRNLNQLMYLDLSGLLGIDINCLSNIINECKKLSECYLRNCPNLNDLALECFINASECISKIDVSACLGISNKSIQKILKHFTLENKKSKIIVLVVGSTAVQIELLRIRNSRVILDLNDSSSLPLDIFTNPSIKEFEGIEKIINNEMENKKNDIDENDGHCNIMDVKKSYIVGALTGIDESPVFNSHEEMVEWAKKEAANLNIQL
ncbi:RNA recognition motif domain and F-box domain and Glycosyl transferase, family 43 and Nucleotide-binding, alpha-beta plait domain-containing protein [Strongyloides ratti]|uniref:Galactosylgalactosylxylosylprotein 3-beta-glucuronosyltransferase n=1 Tax=Strongyloides ratti TaxID=34506 RepID=A0A090KW45_STRRB|nr:RNA recognition motif domain and F-box domain and Glycosyl transferase, family 43 and Nucleotide-binding, alpha-beta plait domain-containing protein [Strongyloides ratti]CEF59497.1 RNA recognition motif domain and F-box domain and Glycosyl transferase, family 43 and Nucleotide-binding, alpha-beta plait domain-containing protein [Strongyloides ratti]